MIYSFLWTIFHPRPLFDDRVEVKTSGSGTQYIEPIDALFTPGQKTAMARAALNKVNLKKGQLVNQDDPRLAFNGEDYCSLRNFISDARKEWTESGALTDEYLDALDEKVRQALIAHRAAVSAEGSET